MPAGGFDTDEAQLEWLAAAGLDVVMPTKITASTITYNPTNDPRRIAPLAPCPAL